eukprot:1190369-Amphidinium_carterae.1
MPPWRKANSNDVHFQWIQHHGVGALLKSWHANMPPEEVRRHCSPPTWVIWWATSPLCEVELLASMLAWNPANRPDARGCAAHPFFAATARHQQLSGEL